MIAPATFKGGRRPYVIVSNERRPFHGDRYTVTVVTSTERDEAVPLTREALTEGELLTYPSYVSPWSLHVFPEREISKRVAQVDDDAMSDVASEIRRLTEVV